MLGTFQNRAKVVNSLPDETFGIPVCGQPTVNWNLKGAQCS